MRNRPTLEGLTVTRSVNYIPMVIRKCALVRTVGLLFEFACRGNVLEYVRSVFRFGRRAYTKAAGELLLSVFLNAQSERQQRATGLI